MFGIGKRRRQALDRRVRRYWPDARHWSAEEARRQLAEAREGLRTSYRDSVLRSLDTERWADWRARAEVAQRRLAQLRGESPA